MGASSFCVSVSLSVKWWKRFYFLQMPSVRDLWELVWKGTSSGQMVNKLCPFRIILSNPSLLLHCKMQGCTHSRLNRARECYLGEAASRSCTELSSLLISGSPLNSLSQAPNSSGSNQHHNVISHFSFPSEAVFLNLIPFKAIFLLKGARLLVIKSCLNCHQSN